MPLIFYMVPTWLGGSIVVALFVLFAVFGIELVCRINPAECRRGYNDIVGFIIAIVGVSYAVLIASVAVIAIEKYDKAEVNVTKEASCLGDIQRASRGLSPEMSRAVRLAAIEYGDTVVSREWPAMRKGQVPQEGWARLQELQRLVLSFEPATMKEQNVQVQMMTKLGDLTDARRERMFIVENNIEPAVWRVVILGNLGVIAFTFFFGLDKRWHQFLSGFLAALSALVIVLIAALDCPYMGKVFVSPAILQQTISRIER